jgi:hypothetical protein
MGERVARLEESVQRLQSELDALAKRLPATGQ